MPIRFWGNRYPNLKPSSLPHLSTDVVDNKNLLIFVADAGADASAADAVVPEPANSQARAK